MSSVASTPSLRLRPSTMYVAWLMSLVVIGVLVVVMVCRATDAHHQRVLERQTQLVAHLALTDLCLFTEASYARHLSQADRFAAFQNHPMASEYFPSGSLTLPPLANQ